jgi:hypothetical protein
VNKIEPLKDDELLQPMQWAEIDARNPLVGYRPSAGIYTLNLEIEEEAWLAFKRSVPKGSLLCVRFYYHDGDPVEDKPAKEKKPAKAKGIHGTFWHKMFADGTGGGRQNQFFNHPDFHTALNLTPPVTSESAKMALREEFDVPSLTFVSPEQFVDFCVVHHLHAIATIASRIASETAKAAV